MTEKDFVAVSAKIDEERDFLNALSQDIWKIPEIAYKEVNAHAVLTYALEKCGFIVEKHYFLSTAFRAEYISKATGGPTIAILCEYDALPEIGHGCGHNLIAEAGVAAAMAVKHVMESDPLLAGKLVVLGTPAEERGGGKIRLIESGAFQDIDVAMMVHPRNITIGSPLALCIDRCYVTYKGKEAHASAYPWEGINALDAAVACYNNISMLRQQIKPNCRVHVIITKGGVAANIIPGESQMEINARAPNVRELEDLRSRIDTCIASAAKATGCEVLVRFDKSNSYQNLVNNQKLVSLLKQFGKSVDMEFSEDKPEPNRLQLSGSTDMGNVSHVIPAIHPFFNIGTEICTHSPGFTEAAGSQRAQVPTLNAAKALAMTALSVFRSSDVLEEVRKEFEAGVQRQADIIEF